MKIVSLWRYIGFVDWQNRLKTFIDVESYLWDEGVSEASEYSFINFYHNVIE
jgi:hypothetical protein